MLSRRSSVRFSPSLALMLLLALLCVLWVAGGASRADLAGQPIVRGAAWAALVIMVLFGKRPAFHEVRPVWLFLSAALLIALMQLLPLPPEIWTALPGRDAFMEASKVTGQQQPWRPWAIVPGAALNAASSLIVPVTVLMLVTSLPEKERPLLPATVLACVAASAMLGLVQFSGSSLNNPLINDTSGQVSANFANRNHFALFMALGCLVTPAWMFLGGRRPRWRGPAGMGMVVLFFLTILASGSRAGLALGAMALVLGLALSWRTLGRALERYPRWVFPALIAGIALLVLAFVLLSVAADRAASISRIVATDQAQDMRRRGLPVVLEMIRTYFPVGSGLGGFDPLFRMHEPFDLLKPTYFNHAHNDFLEVALDAGLPGILLLLAALAWWARASLRAWRTSVADPFYGIARLGSAVLLLVIVASIFDYPVRTPIFMAVTVIAGVWLSQACASPAPSPLPSGKQHL